MNAEFGMRNAEFGIIFAPQIYAENPISVEANSISERCKTHIL